MAPEERLGRNFTLAAIVYHLRGQTGRSTVWANGTQNSGLVNFVPESRLLFVQISSTDQKTTTKAWSRYQRDGFKEMEHEFPFGIFRPEKTGLPFQMFRCSRKFSNGTTHKVVFHLLSNGIFRLKQAYLFRCFIASGNFPMERPIKSCSIYFPNGFSGKFW